MDCVVGDGQSLPFEDARFDAAISAFGLSGTNAHLVLEEGPPESAPKPAGDYLVALSAPSAARLKAVAESWAAWIETNPDLVAHAAE